MGFLGGAALLTGLYDENTLAALGELASGHRLIYLLDVLGQTQTALNGSGSLRTEAELCLMKLCDESLCGDLSALTARLERLEKAAAKGLAVPISAAPAAPAAPQTQTPPPAPAAPARTESPAPTAPASPKPKPKADPAPQAQAPKPEPITPVPQPKTSPAGGDSGIWDRLKEHYKAALRVDKRVFLNGASGTLSVASPKKKPAVRCVWFLPWEPCRKPKNIIVRHLHPSRKILHRSPPKVYRSRHSRIRSRSLPGNRPLQVQTA